MTVSFNPLDLSDRTIMITGASSGIGRETAILLSNLGARVVLVARNRQRLEKTANVLKADNHYVEPFNLNATSEIPDWLRTVVARTGPLYGLVHCAGIQITVPLRFQKSEQLSEVMRINFEAAVQLAKGFRHKKVFVPGGSIVFLSSVMGLVGQPGVSAYAASKGALIALSKSLAIELARERIRVNCIAAGLVHTQMAENFKKSLTAEQFAAVESMYPLGTGQAVDVAYAAAFLLANTGRWVTGATLVVDGGYTAQ